MQNSRLFGQLKLLFVGNAKKRLVIGARDFASHCGHQGFKVAPEIDAVKEGVQPTGCDAVRVVVGAGVVNAVVLGGEGNAVRHAKLSNGIGAVLMGPLVELVREGDEQREGDDKEVEGHGSDAAAADRHKGDDSEHRNGSHSIISVSLDKVVLGHSGLVNMVLAKRADKETEDESSSAAPSVQTPVGNATGQVSKENGTKDRGDGQCGDCPIRIRGMSHESTGANHIIDKQGKGSEQAEVLHCPLSGRVAFSQLFGVSLSGR